MKPYLMSDLNKVTVHAILKGDMPIECKHVNGDSFTLDPLAFGGDIEIHGTLDELIPKLVTSIERRLRGDLVAKRMQHGDALMYLAQALPSSHTDLIGRDVEEREAHTPFGELSQKWDTSTQTTRN